MSDQGTGGYRKESEHIADTKVPLFKKQSCYRSV